MLHVLYILKSLRIEFNGHCIFNEKTCIVLIEILHVYLRSSYGYCILMY